MIVCWRRLIVCQLLYGHIEHRAKKRRKQWQSQNDGHHGSVRGAAQSCSLIYEDKTPQEERNVEGKDTVEKEKIIELVPFMKSDHLRRAKLKFVVRLSCFFHDFRFPSH